MLNLKKVFLKWYKNQADCLTSVIYTLLLRKLTNLLISIIYKMAAVLMNVKRYIFAQVLTSDRVRRRQVWFHLDAAHDASHHMRHPRNRLSSAAVIAFLRRFTQDPLASDRRSLRGFSPCYHPPSPCCLSSAHLLSLAIPFLRCWTITLSRKAVAAITPAPKLLRHLGASLVLLHRNDGDQRGGHTGRRRPERWKRWGKRDGGG